MSEIGNNSAEFAKKDYERKLEKAIEQARQEVLNDQITPEVREQLGSLGFEERISGIYEKVLFDERIVEGGTSFNLRQSVGRMSKEDRILVEEKFNKALVSKALKKEIKGHYLLRCRNKLTKEDADLIGKARRGELTEEENKRINEVMYGSEGPVSGERTDWNAKEIPESNEIHRALYDKMKKKVSNFVIPSEGDLKYSGSLSKEELLRLQGLLGEEEEVKKISSKSRVALAARAFLCDLIDNREKGEEKLEKMINRIEKIDEKSAPSSLASLAWSGMSINALEHYTQRRGGEWSDFRMRERSDIHYLPETE